MRSSQNANYYPGFLPALLACAVLEQPTYIAALANLLLPFVFAPLRLGTALLRAAAIVRRFAAGCVLLRFRQHADVFTFVTGIHAPEPDAFGSCLKYLGWTFGVSGIPFGVADHFLQRLSTATFVGRRQSRRPSFFCFNSAWILATITR